MATKARLLPPHLAHPLTDGAFETLKRPLPETDSAETREIGRGVMGDVLPTKDTWRPPRLDHAAARVAVRARAGGRGLGPRVLEPRVARNSGRRACGSRVCGGRPREHRNLSALRRCDRSFTPGRLDRVNDSVVETGRPLREPPDGITAGEQLAVEVYAIDPRGKPLCNALVEVTWELGDEQIR